MPNRDGTGPNGNGPRAGRKMGNCKETETSEIEFGRGRGFNKPRRGFGRRINNLE